MRNSRFDYTPEEIRAVPQGHLLSMEIEFSRKCNYRCPYCYASADAGGSPELSDAEIQDVLRQAAALGARKIVILGGEPMLDPELEEKIEWIDALGMGVEIFTNGSLMTEERAAFFFRKNCRIVVKLNTLNPALHDELTGHRDSLALSLKTIRLLKEAGYGSSDGMLCAATVLSASNLEEAPALWRTLRQWNIAPYFECLTPQGRLLEYRSLLPEIRRVKRVFEEIAAIDAEYGHMWDIQPPLVGQKCFRHQYSCVVNSNGNVIPCVGLDAVIGNIRDQKLGEILAESLILRNLRDYRKHLKTPCRECEKSDHCYGCRGTAWQLTGDYLAADPMCWNNADQWKKIDVLPVDASPLIPHRPPVAMAGQIVKITDRGGETLSVIRPDNPFLKGDGTLDSSALIELAAQSAAALDSFMNHKTVRPGMLAGVNSFSVSGRVRAGDSIRISCRKESEFPPWHIIAFRGFDGGGTEITQGVLKLCILEES